MTHDVGITDALDALVLTSGLFPKQTKYTIEQTTAATAAA